MRLDASEKNLLYVSSHGNNGEDVYVYSYPGGDPEGTLTGFALPSGECVDKGGNIFITNYNGHDVLEYAHGGTQPIGTLQDPYSYPIDCAIDPSTGNLAVANYVGANGYGNIAIYERAQGEPIIYADSSVITLLRACVYDHGGNLFLDGDNAQLAFTVAEIAKGSTSFVKVTMPKVHERYGLGPLSWDGKYVAIGNFDDNLVYRLSISGAKAKIVGSTVLTGIPGSNLFSIPKLGSGRRDPQGTKLIDPNTLGGDVEIWDYPAGGAPIKTIGGAGEPVGAAVSPAKR
jgi:hypothetical protein